jgi:beta-galactosidase
VRQILLLPILLILVTLGAFAQSQPVEFLASPPTPDRSVYTSLTSASTRSIISLNGRWQVSRDGGDSWRDIAVPSCFNGEGELLYRRTFQIPPELIGRFRWRLLCNGIQYQSTVSINGQFVAQHESGMPFSFSVPEEVKLGPTNTIQVDVSNHLGYTSTVPGRKLLLGDRTYGGIFRDIILVGVPRVWVEDVRVQTEGNASAMQAKFNVRIVSGAIKGMQVGKSGDSAGVPQTIATDLGDFDLNIILRRPSGVDTLPAGEVARGGQTFSLGSKRTANIAVTIPVASPSLWGPGSPNLYDAVVQVRYHGALVDEQPLRFGFRTFGSRGDKVLLNGQPLEVKGVTYVEDSKEFGASLSYELMRRDIQAIRDMGANVIRFNEGSPHPYLLQLCDELGIMAFIDVPIGTPPGSLFNDESYLKRSLDRVKFVTEEAGRYSCVVAYGLSAVIPGHNKDAVDAVRRMRGVIDSLDFRPVYFSATEWTDPELRKLADIAGLTAFDVDPVKVRGMIAEMLKELGGSRPLVMLNYGKFVQLGNHNGYNDPISIEAQAKYISDIYNILKEKEIGGIYWSFNDYRTDRPVLTVNNTEPYLATCGLFGLDRDLRQSATMLTALYTDQKTPDVLIGDYAPPSTVLFIAVGIACAIVFLLLINNSRRFRENVFRALLRPYNFYADIRDQRILSNVQTTVLGLVIAATFAVIAASLCYFYRMDERFDAILSATVTVDFAKAFLNYIIWRPAFSIIFFTLFFFLLLLAVAGLIRLCAAFVRNRIFFSDAYIIAIWGALPVLLLIPIAMIVYRLLAVPGAGAIAFLEMVLVMVWMLYRVLRGAAVIYDVRPLKVYGYALGGIAAILLIMVVTSSDTSATLSYLSEGISGLYSGR